MFSAGLVLLEMFTGYPVFETHTDGEHMEMMEVVLGPMPVEFSKKVLCVPLLPSDLATSTADLVTFLNRSSKAHPTKFKRGRLSLPVAPLYLRNPTLLASMESLQVCVG